MGYGQAADGLRGRFSPSAPNTYYMFEWDPQGSLVQRQTGGTNGNNLTDALGTALFDGYGVKLSDMDAPYGGTEAARDSMGFQGQFGAYTDNETNLVLMGHRHYDAGTGRFLTRDPKGYGGGINLYGFTGNNPVNESDPDGTDALILYGENFYGHGGPDPTFFPRIAQGRAAEYREQNQSTGQRAYITELHNASDLQTALDAHRNIDTIFFLCHGTSTYLSFSHDFHINSNRVNNINPNNVLGAHIEIDGCRAGNVADGVAQALADRFRSTVTAFAGKEGSSFGYNLHGFVIDPYHVRVLPIPFDLGPSAHPVNFYPKTPFIQHHDVRPTNPMDSDGNYPP